MKSINWGRVIMGGIAAGIVINISEYLLNEVAFKKVNEEAMKALGKTMPEGGSTILVWLLWGFLLGISAVWLYAAIRTRYGAGAATAIKAGVAVWVMAQLLATIVFWNLGLFPLTPVILLWTLVESIVATVVGAWLYREEAA
jgi:hypothetical protein